MQPAFRVNTYTTNNQQWSTVAMDTHGDFVVTWSSMGQEDNGQMGDGWGVYARRYDSYGAALAPEFPVNLTVGGNQQFSSVAMDQAGGFVVAWQSNQDGVSNNIYYRSFDSNGDAQEGPLSGEHEVNTVTDGVPGIPRRGHESQRNHLCGHLVQFRRRRQRLGCL